MVSRPLPSALDRWEDVLARLRGRPPALFLDFDGTLAPIAPRPQDAALPARTRDVLRALATAIPTAIVTGRGLDDIRDKVGLPSLVYAANHGFEIDGPGLRHEAEPALREVVGRAAAATVAALGDIEGVVIESKGFSVAVHYRLAAPAVVGDLERTVADIVARDPVLRVLTGKKVIELRPRMAWHKGSAVDWILRRLGNDPRRAPIFCGDDRTDEDALLTVADEGVGVSVGNPQWETAAHFRLEDPSEVETFLRRLTSQFGPS